MSTPKQQSASQPINQFTAPISQSAVRPMLKADTFYIWYFYIHLVLVIVCDVTIVLPPEYLLPFQLWISRTNVEVNGDILALTKPAWLLAYVWIEVLLQVPFFALAPSYLRKNDVRIYPFAVIYGIEASTSTLACLVTVATSDVLGLAQKARLFSVYLPWFLIPLIISIDFTRRLLAKLSQLPTNSINNDSINLANKNKAKLT